MIQCPSIPRLLPVVSGHVSKSSGGSWERHAHEPRFSPPKPKEELGINFGGAAEYLDSLYTLIHYGC